MEDDPQASSGNDERTERDDQAKKQVASVLASVDPQPKPIVEVASGQPGERNSHEQNDAKRQKTLERSTVVQAGCAVAIVIFTFAQVLVGYWQWSATRDQYNAMVFDQRPWLGIETPKVIQFTPAHNLECTIETKNFGKTPAIVTRACSAIIFLNLEPSEDGRITIQRGFPEVELNIKRLLTILERAAEANKQSDVLMPGASVGFPQVGENVPLTQEQFTAIKNGRVFPVVLARSAYTDTSGGKPKAIWSCFCYRHEIGEHGAFVRNNKYNHVE